MTCFQCNPPERFESRNTNDSSLVALAPSLRATCFNTDSSRFKSGLRVMSLKKYFCLSLARPTAKGHKEPHV